MCQRYLDFLVTVKLLETSSVFFRLKIGYSNGLKRETSPSLIKDGRRRAADCKFQVPAHQETRRKKFFNLMFEARKTQAMHRATDCKFQVSRHREIGRIRFQNGSIFFRKRCLIGEPPDSHNVVVEKLAGEPEENPLVEL